MRWFDRTAKEICNDCGKKMRVAIFFYAFQELLAGFVSVYAASVFGEFTNAVFMEQYDFGIKYFLRLDISVGCIVIIVPLVETLGEVTMFSKSLDYCSSMYLRFLEKTYDSVRKLDMGEIQYSLEGDVIEFYIQYTDIIIKILTLPFIFLYLLFNACRISVIFMLLVFGISVIKVGLKFRLQKRKTYFEQKRREYASRLRGREVELLSSPHQFILFNIYKYWIKITNDDYREYHEEVEKQSIKFDVLLEHLNKFSNYLCSVVVLLIGAVMVAKGMILPGAVAEMIGYFSIFTSLDEKAVEFTSNIYSIKNLIERMKLIYADREDDTQGRSIDRIRNIALDNIAFSYDEKKEAYLFENLNLDIPEKSKVVICGHNGSGKSTLIKILCRLLKIDHGNIIVNGKRIDDINISCYRKNIAYAMQSPYLFKGTVKENIILGNLDEDDSKVFQIMEMLGITYLADRVIDNNTELSGGEKQKISIARALLRRPSILILDEPENHLDPTTRRCLQTVMEQFPNIVIFVSHDEELKECADLQVNL